MTQVTYPGVYIQEIPSGVRPIRAVATSIAAFVDFFREGPMNEPVRIQGPGDFNRRFGGLDARSEASYAIAQFFLNGGSEAYVVRVASDDPTDATNTPRRAEVRVREADASSTTVVMTARARNEGVWGNSLRLQISLSVDDAGGLQSFNLTVVRYDPDEPQRVVAAEGPFRNLSLDEDNARYFPSVVNEESQMIRVVHGAYDAGVDGDWDDLIDAGGRADSPPGANVFPAANGTLGGPLPTALDGIASGDFRIDVQNEGGTSITGVHRATYTAPTAPSGGEVTLQMVRRAVEQAIHRSVPIIDAAGNPIPPPPPAAPPHPAHALLAGASVELVGRRLLVRCGRRSPGYEGVARVVLTEHGGSTANALRLFGSTGVFEAVQQYSLGTAVTVGAQEGHADFEGKDGVPPNAADLHGEEGDRTGIYALKGVDLFNILCIPRAAELGDPHTGAVVDKAIAFCEEQRAMFIIDIPANVNTVEEMETWMQNHDGFRHRNTAVYFPRVVIPDPEDEYRDRSIGASGTMAGIYSRTDTTRGVWKAPAGVEASLRGSRLDANLTDDQNGTLNPIAVNCLRRFPIYGPVSWGARTLAGADEAASEWKYVPIRRLALMIEETLFRGTKWVVFEPNDEPLWAKIRQNVGAFMMGLFRQGAFQGDTPNKAFYVKCDGETTTALDRNLGVVNIEVGFAPLKPAEFVVIKIQQIPDVE